MFVNSSSFSFQVLFGQYAKAGPLGIWRSFPLARGVGIVWAILIFVGNSWDVPSYSRVMVYIYAVSMLPIGRLSSINPFTISEKRKDFFSFS